VSPLCQVQRAQATWDTSRTVPSSPPAAYFTTSRKKGSKRSSPPRLNWVHTR